MSTVDPVVLEIVQGSLAAIELEVETAIGRTARSPMIRDAHDFRAGIHDRQLRKLTGRIVGSGKSRATGCTSAE
jgi:N-methylhydantoinase B